MPTWSFEEVRAPDPAADAPEALIEVVVATVERTQTNVLMKRLHSALPLFHSGALVGVFLGEYGMVPRYR